MANENNIEIESKVPNMKVGLGEKIGYSLGDASANLVFQMMMIFQLKFYTDIFGLDGAIAGSVLLIARIVDAFVDPAAGILSDKTQTKWGKYRPWVLWSALPFAVFYVLAFYNPGIEDKGLVALYATISYILLMTMYSINNTPYSSLGGVMSSDIRERTSITSIRFVASTIAQFVVQDLSVFFGVVVNHRHLWGVLRLFLQRKLSAGIVEELVDDVERLVLFFLHFHINGEQIAHVVVLGIYCRRLPGLSCLFLIVWNVMQEVVYERCSTALCYLRILCQSFLMLLLHSVVCCLNEVEEHFSVSKEYCCPSQFVVERRVVQQKEILQQQDACWLIIWILSRNLTQFVQRLTVEVLRMFYECFCYQFATVALNIWSQISFDICVTSCS